MDTETWKPIVGYEGLYEVSSYGNVRSLDRYVPTSNGYMQFFHGKMMKQHITERGYYAINLCRNCIKTGMQVHRLVGYAFLGIPPEECTDINHKDGNKLNNHVENLEWCTRSHNIQHAYDIGLHPRYTEKQREAVVKAIGKPVYCIDNDTIYESQYEASRQLGISRDQVMESVKRHGKISQCGTHDTNRYRIIDLKEKDDYVYKPHDQSLLFQERRFARIANTDKIYKSINDFCEDTNMLYQAVHNNIKSYNGYVPDLDVCLVDCGYEETIPEIDYELDRKLLYDGRRLAISKRYKTSLRCSNGHTYLSPVKCTTKYFPSVNRTYINDCIRKYNGHASKLNLDFICVSPLDLTDDEIDEILDDYLENIEVFMEANRPRRKSSIS